tara:strand:+ start:4432 stop:4878 length:447 start_codon:yes stop_codon:yes gene_type:complete
MIKNNDVEKYSKDEIWASGTYHHHDGYPNAMGKFLMLEFQDKGWSWLRSVVEHSWSSLPNNECYCCGTMRDGRREPFEERTNISEDGGWSDIEWIYLFSQDRDGSYIDVIQGSDVNQTPSLVVNLTREKNVNKVAKYFDELNMHALGF